jgi:hypothetical protein
MWTDHLQTALTRAKGWGQPAEALRIRIRRALDSKDWRTLREAADAYAAYRGVERPPPLRAAAPYSPAEAPRGCGVRREENWGPKGSWILNGGRFESKG